MIKAVSAAIQSGPGGVRFDSSGDRAGYPPILSALLGTALATNLTETGHPNAPACNAAVKALGVDTAHRVVTELAPLLGAGTFRTDCPIAKTGRDLSGLRCADGIHDSLYRAAGKHHMTIHNPMPAPRRASEPATPASST